MGGALEGALGGTLGGVLGGTLGGALGGMLGGALGGVLGGALEGVLGGALGGKRVHCDRVGGHVGDFIRGPRCGCIGVCVWGHVGSGGKGGAFGDIWGVGH